MLFVRCYSNVFLKPAKFDIKAIIQNLELYKGSVEKRQLVNGSQLVSRLDKDLQVQYEMMRTLNKSIADVQGQRKVLERGIRDGKSPDVFTRVKALKDQFNEYSKQLGEVEGRIQSICIQLPNLVHHTVPDEVPIVEKWINKDKYKEFKEDETRDHVKIMTQQKQLMDLTTASNITGNSWYYLLNEGAQLETALVNYALDKAEEHGFSRCIPPSIARKEMIDACGFAPRDMNNEKQIYEIDNQGLGLTATAEITLAGLYANKVVNFDSNEIAKKIVGVSRSYRAEAGARGRDTKGLYRVHEFTKVELFCWSKPTHSEQILNELRDFQIDIIDSLGLCAQVLNMPANDLGNPAYKKYDIEVWMPGRGKFGEVSSTSNCTDFQSRRLGTRYKNADTAKLEYVHTLNGTAMAVPRMILAIVENCYDPATNQIAIPKPLIPYMNGKEYI